MRPMLRLDSCPGLKPALLVGSLLLAGAVPIAANAQWAWRENSGSTTFSDTPPPADVRQGEILRQPSAPMQTTAGRHADVAQSTPPAPPTLNIAPARVGQENAGAPADRDSRNKPSSGPKTLAEQDADFRKRLAERQKAEQKQADDEAQAAQRSAACAQARSYLQVIESGTRLMRPDSQGNRNFLDEEQRAAETQKTQEQIAQNC
jgi:hypothetical protein